MKFKNKLLLTGIVAVVSFSAYADWEPEYEARILFIKDKTVSLSDDVEQFYRDRVSHLNKVLRSSDANLKFDYAGFLHDKGHFESLGEFSKDEWVQHQKALFKADFVFLWSNSAVDGTVSNRCGVAYIAKTNNLAYAVAKESTKCNESDIFVHEIGHNLGLTHDYSDYPDEATSKYAAGYGNWAWVTMMGHTGVNGGYIQKQVFSNPRIDCDAFYTCGDTVEGDAVRYINETVGKRFKRDVVGNGQHVTLYAKNSNNGQKFKLNKSMPNLQGLGKITQSIGSFEIPTGWKVRFYTEPDYQGKYYTRDHKSADQRNFTNGYEVKSIKILERNSIPVIYSEGYGGGQSLDILRSYHDLSEHNFSGKMRSFDIPKYWTLRFYEEPNYQGGYYTRGHGADDENYFEIGKGIKSIQIINRP